MGARLSMSGRGASSMRAASVPMASRSRITVASDSSGPIDIGTNCWSECPVRPVPAARSIESSRSCVNVGIGDWTVRYAEALIGDSCGALSRLNDGVHSGGATGNREGGRGTSRGVGAGRSGNEIVGDRSTR